MSQILAALTHQYVLVASDRQLTFSSGPRKGEIADDDNLQARFPLRRLGDCLYGILQTSERTYA